MLYDIDGRKRGLMYRDKLAFIDTAMSWIAPTIAILMSRWAQDLGPDKVAILVSVAHMSLGNGRIACELPLTIFNKGNAKSEECPTFSGLGMSINTARRHVEALCKEDFLHLHRVVNKAGDLELGARVAEINFKKLFSASEIAKVGIKLNTNTPSNFGRGPYEYIHRYFVPSLSSLGLDKSNLSPSASGTPGEAGVGITTSTNRVPMLATPKRQRPTKDREETCEAVIARVTNSSTATRGARADAAVAAPVSQLTVQGLQALIDKAMLTYLPNQPRVIVTHKPFGLMRSRLKEARVADLGDFIEFTIRSWFSIASQNKAAYRKDVTRMERGSALPSAPSFSALAYKLPYFLAVYANHLIERPTQDVGKTAAERRVAIVEAQLKRAREDNEALRRRRRTQPPKREQAPLQRQQQEVKLVDALDDDWIPPAWDGWDDKRKKA